MPRKKDIHLKALVDAVESGAPRRDYETVWVQVPDTGNSLLSGWAC